MTSPIPFDRPGRVHAVNVGQPRTLTAGTVDVTTFRLWEGAGDPVQDLSGGSWACRVV